MKLPYIVHPTLSEMAAAVAADLAAAIAGAARNNTPYFVALSGGSTPGALFGHLARPETAREIRWEWVHFFWGDERCVPPDHPESNYGMARRMLFDHIPIPAENIHRIRGESGPAKEAVRYAREIMMRLPADATGRPVFDRIFLGMGEDGHTASLFPGSPALTESDKICTVAIHPVSGQKRITLTLPVINAAREVHFLVSGAAKSDRVAQIFHQTSGYEQLPAAKIHPPDGKLLWHLDREAAAGIEPGSLSASQRKTPQS